MIRGGGGVAGGSRWRRVFRSAATLAAAAALSLAGACSAQGKSAGQASPVPRLHAQGRWLVDQLGRVVMAHGVAVVRETPPYYILDDPGGFEVRDADWLAQHGFSAVRIALTFGGIMPEPGKVSSAYLAAWDRVVKLLAARHIWILFDLQQNMFSEDFGGYGFPSWAVHTNGHPLTTPTGTITDYTTPAFNAAWDDFWANRYGLWGYYRQALMAVAAKWRDQPYLMGYEVMNEPYPGSQAISCIIAAAGCPVFDTGKMQAMEDYMLDGIRQVDPANIVWLEPNLLFNSGTKSNLGTLKPVDRRNIGFSWHSYCDWTGPVCRTKQAATFANAQQAGARIGAPTLMSELANVPTLDQMANSLNEAEAGLSGWMYWKYKREEWGNASKWGLFANDADLSSLRQAAAQLLVQTYPEATAGIPASLSYDPGTGDFSYTYTPRSAGGPTVIYVPAGLPFPDVYPHGYDVSVIGARVISTPGASLLELENDRPFASRVSVTITPRSATAKR